MVLIILLPVIKSVIEIKIEINPIDWKNKSEIKLPLNPKIFLISILSGNIKFGASGE